MLKKNFLCALLLATSFSIYPNFLQDLLPKYPPDHFQKLMTEDAIKAWHVRFALGFIGGFCTHAFSQNITIANIFGLPITPTMTYLVNNYAPIITQKREWLDVAGAYLVGALAGRLARAAYQKASEKLGTIFDKPEARVALTVRSPEEN